MLLTVYTVYNVYCCTFGEFKMTTTQTQPKPAKPIASPTKTTTVAAKSISPKPVKKTLAVAKATPIAAKMTELPVENQIPQFIVKKKKNEKKKVIRDSFSFPEQDYHKISELKKICLAAGIHVKKGEILRAGLHLLTNLKLSELVKAIETVEKVPTGRPKSSKK